MRVYLDVCCPSRLTDDQSQPRIRDEAAAVEAILRMVREGRVTWVSSAVVTIEISRNPHVDRRRDIEALVQFAHTVVLPGSEARIRANHLERLGFAPFDAMHRASAEQSGADVFLSTDDDLVRRAARHREEIGVAVANPLFWYRSYLGTGDDSL